MALKCIVLANNPDKEARHAAVLEAVRKYFGNDEVMVNYGETGKPSITGAKKYISVTTTGEKMIVALSDSPVGIDLQDTEAAMKISNINSFAGRFFAPDEYEAFTEEPTHEQLCRIWTRKEALAKLLGRPLNTSLSSLSSLNYPGVIFETRRALLEKEFFLTLAKKQ